MTIPFWCVVVIVFLPYVATVLSSRHRKEQFGGYDNATPRVQAEKLTGTGARVWGAHQNALEIQAAFIAAVVIAHIQGADAVWSAVAALFFTACRILHMVAYISGRDSLRSALFGISMACVLALFLMAAFV